MKINKTLVGIVLLAAGLNGCKLIERNKERLEKSDTMLIEYDNKNAKVRVEYLNPILNNNFVIDKKLIVEFDDGLSLEIYGKKNGQIGSAFSKYDRAKSQQLHDKVLEKIRLR